MFLYFFFRARQLASLDKFFFRSCREPVRGLDGSIAVNIIELCHYQRNQTEINSTLSNRSINYDFNSLEKTCLATGLFICAGLLRNGDRQNTAAQSMDYPNGLPKNGISSKIMFK